MVQEADGLASGLIAGLVSGLIAGLVAGDVTGAATVGAALPPVLVHAPTNNAATMMSRASRDFIEASSLGGRNHLMTVGGQVGLAGTTL
jgi:hypothetical protein